MIQKNKYQLLIAGAVLTLLFSFMYSNGEPARIYYNYQAPEFNFPDDSTKKDTTKNKVEKYVKTTRPTYQEQDRYEDRFTAPGNNSSLNSDLPGNIQLNFNPDDSLQNYEVSETIGDMYYRTPTTMTYEQFLAYKKKEQISDYWGQINSGEEGGELGNDRLIPKIALSPDLDRIFGGNFVDIRPNGAVTISLGGRWQRTFNPALPKQQQRYGGLNFEQNITLNLNGAIGEKMKITMNWNTGAQFDFQNNIKLDYTGFDHEIIQDIDAGNVSMPLPTQLITAGQNLFGLKMEMKFGRLYWTSVISTQRSKSEEIVVENGAQNRLFELRASEYEDNRHFFLSHYFRDKYEKSFSLPNIVSDVQINRIEVYVMNTRQQAENLRSIAAFMDLGEADPYNNGLNGSDNEAVRNEANILYRKLREDTSYRNPDEIENFLTGNWNMINGQDYQIISSARKLEQDRDFTVHPQLGYISLNSRLQNDEVLAVAFEYTVNGAIYKVGELFDDYGDFRQDQLIYLKLLRPASINTRLPMWDLMMKNVYSLGTSQVNQDNFRMRIVYKDDRSGIDNPSLVDDSPIKDIPLVQVMGADKVNQNGDRQPDASYDFVDKGGGTSFLPVTIDARRGRVYFPVLEPFGENLERQLDNDQRLIRKYVYNELYASTKNDAEQQANKNKFLLKGSYQSASSDEIMLPGIQIEEGSVKVLAGGTPLTEGVDYTVNYSLGRVKITNQGVLNSGKKIKIQFEKPDILTFRPRTLFANRFDYRFSDNFVIGGTLLRLTSRPFFNKIQAGDEPINNTMVGTDFSYSTDSRLLTKMVDKIPLINTKEMSSVSVSGEFAQMIPGHSKAIQVDEGSEEGVAYIDDFEGTEAAYLLSGNVATAAKWKLASTPQRFGEADSSNLAFTKNRAKFAWYTVARNFYNSFSGQQPELEDAESENIYSKQFIVQEVFPQRSQNQTDNQLYTLDLSYWPNERGQYNYDTENINPTTGKFNNPQERWGGVMRSNDYDVDFDNANVEYIEFWMMDPFAGPFNAEDDQGNPIQIANETGGKMYINIGNISEDVMKDNRYAFENGLPTDGSTQHVEETDWGIVTKNQFISDGFSNVSGTRSKQDVGLDGLNSANEKDFFSEYLNALPPDVANLERSDPSNDDFKYFLGDDYDQRKTPIIQRYKNFNNLEGNSPEGDAVEGYTTLPDKEDLNRDNTLSTSESYYEYEVSLFDGMDVGDGYIVDKSIGGGATWYQFRIPIRDPNGRTNVNNIDGFKSIRFLRMYLTQWRQPVVLRMAEFQYVEAQWRRVKEDLAENTVGSVSTPSETFFTISAVNIEENGGESTSGNDIPYNLPPDVNRQQNLSNPGYTTLQNEQALNLCVENLKAGDARGVFKNTGFDLINYETLKMYLHAHSLDAQDGEVTAFIRLGIDKDLNYYEYEIPLTMTPFGTSQEDRNGLWPEENRLEVSLKALIELKKLRGFDFPYDSVYTISDPNKAGARMKVKGNPDMSEVNIIMLGIRNPGSGRDVNGNITGDPKQVCVWFNELRMNGFNEKGGWAALGNMNARLADFATVNVSGSHTHIGFGSISQTLNQRARENTTGYDLNSTILLNKFLPVNWNIQLPMYVGYDKTSIAPQYDPLKPDLILKSSIENIRESEGREEAEEYKRQTQDITTRKSINFTNVKKNRSPKAKIKTPIDVSNFAVSYAFTEQERVNINTEYDIETRRNGSLNYNYAPKALNIEPLKKVKLFEPAYLQLFKDINFNPIPGNFTFRAELDRYYNEQQLRTLIQGTNELTTDGFEPNFNKKINFRRQYGFRWNLAKSISLDYSANVNAAVDERAGRINREDDDYQEKLDVIKTNLYKFGRTSSFDQNATLTYKVPIDKIPLLDWTNTTVSYKSNYNWTAGPVTIDENGVATPDSLGNTIQNGNTKTVNGSMNFVKLYNKSKYLKEINNPRPTRAKPQPTSRTKGKEAEEEEEEKKKDLKALKTAMRTLMMVRSANFNLAYTEGTMIPGYMNNVKYFGLDESFTFPGYPFVFGMQNDSIHKELQRNGQLTNSYYFNQPLNYSTGFNGSYKAVIEPFDDFKLTLDASHNWNNNNTFTYKDTLIGADEIMFAELNNMNTGMFSTSIISVRTLFIGDKVYEDSISISPVFDDFREVRADVQETLNVYNQNDADSAGYGINSQDVLIPAFLHAYTGKDINTFDPKQGEKSVFPQIPLPNWNVSYRGLSKVKFFKKWFTSVNLNHRYSSTYSVSSYNTSLQYAKAGKERFTGENYYNQNASGLDNVNITNQVSNDYIPYYLITQVSIRESMDPILGLDLRTKSKMSFKISYGKTRNLALSMTNAQVTEMRSDKFNLTYGFSKKGLELGFPFKYLNKAENIIFPNEMNFAITLQLTDNATYQRFLEDNRSLATAGTFSLRFNPTIDYDISRRLNVQLYFMRTINNPKISTSFKTTMTEFGARVKFNLN